MTWGRLPLAPNLHSSAGIGALPQCTVQRLQNNGGARQQLSVRRGRCRGAEKDQQG